MRRPAELPIGTVYDCHVVAGVEHPPGALRSAELEVLEMLPNDDIKNALDALPVDFRMAVYYADVEGLAVKEISEIMGTPLGTVMSRIHRGRSQLRVLLAALAAGRSTSSRRTTGSGSTRTLHVAV